MGIHAPALRIFGLVSLFAATTLPAQNLLTNPELDENIDHWYFDTHGGQDWTSDDSDGCPFSGTLEAEALETTPGFWGFSTRPMDQVAVTPGETVHAAIRFRAPGAFFGRLYLTYCASEFNCGSFSAFLDFASGSADWVTLEGSDLIPAGIQFVFLTIDATSATASFEIDVDRAYLGRQPRIFNDSFEATTPCRWSSSEG